MEQTLPQAGKLKTVRYINKNQSLYQLISKVKLWPSRSGTLHGVVSVDNKGDSMVVTTHCGETFTVWNSKNSRSARWLRNRWYKKPCDKCRVPDWKLLKYSQTIFSDSGRRGARL
jgi:pyrrolysyl-tRNA synthetase-like protein